MPWLRSRSVVFSLGEKRAREGKKVWLAGFGRRGKSLFGRRALFDFSTACLLPFQQLNSVCSFFLCGW
jgi:hypothetical protein